MSYDINFWKLQRPLELSAQEIYQQLCEGKAVEGLEKLPVDRILERLQAAYPDFDPKESFPLARTSEGSIEFSWSDHHFRFDLRGICAECQKVVDIMTEFGCPMYDPQAMERYDSQNGMAVAEPPKFETATPEQKAAIERIKKEFLEKISGTPQGKGCARAAAILVLILGSMAVGIIRRLGVD